MAETEELGHNSGLTIDRDVALKLYEDIAEAEAAGASARGDLGNLYKKAENDIGLNRKGVKFVRVMQKMTPNERADFWRTADALMDHLDLKAFDPDLFDDEDSDEGANVGNFESDDGEPSEPEPEDVTDADGDTEDPEDDGFEDDETGETGN